MSGTTWLCCGCERDRPAVSGCPLCYMSKTPTVTDCPSECDTDGQHLYCEGCLSTHLRNTHDWIPEAAALMAHAALIQVAAEDSGPASCWCGHFHRRAEKHGACSTGRGCAARTATHEPSKGAA